MTTDAFGRTVLGNPLVGLDPLTKRVLSKHCWNGIHGCCAGEDDHCECVCHEMLPSERRQRGLPVDDDE
jgi:hypothetical protein